MSQQHLLLDFCPQPLQNRAMGRPIIQVESHNMRTDRTQILTFFCQAAQIRCVLVEIEFDTYHHATIVYLSKAYILP